MKNKQPGSVKDHTLSQQPDHCSCGCHHGEHNKQTSPSHQGQKKNDAACSCKHTLSEDGRKLLEQAHSFPGEYTFKLIGFKRESPADSLKVQAILAAALVLEGEQHRINATSRASSGNRYESVTMDIMVDDVDQVLAIYKSLRNLEGLVTLI